MKCYFQSVKEAARRNARGENYDKGDFVAAVWGETWWIGVVQKEVVNRRYVVKFMHPVAGSKHTDCKIDWPATDDIDDVAREDILCPVSKPVPTMHKAKWCFSLPPKEVQAIKDRFAVIGDYSEE